MRLPEIRPGVRRLFHLAVRRPERVDLRLRAEQLAREGLDPESARREAERRFGPLDEARSRLHDSARRREHAMRMHEWLDGARRGKSSAPDAHAMYLTESSIWLILSNTSRPPVPEPAPLPPSHDILSQRQVFL